MFISKRKYSKLCSDASIIAAKYTALLDEWNDLVKQINAKGGESFLNGDTQQLSQEDIKRLLSLCHPDKHGGKQSAVEMTQKLLELRD